MSASELPDDLVFLDSPVEQLKKQFPIAEISKKVVAALPPECGFKGLASWEEFESIRGMLRFLAAYQERANRDYFISHQTELIYSLVKLQGEAQQSALGVTSTLYRSNAKAKAWWRKLSLIVHPDRCKHRGATSATEQLNLLYEEMMKHGR